LRQQDGCFTVHVNVGRREPQADRSRVNRLGLSARAFNKVLRVARTVADLDGDERVRASHIGEAIQGRILDRNERR
jgi:magnesium chelatase family protein